MKRSPASESDSPFGMLAMRSAFTMEQRLMKRQCSPSLLGLQAYQSKKFRYRLYQNSLKNCPILHIKQLKSLYTGPDFTSLASTITHCIY